MDHNEWNNVLDELVVVRISSCNCCTGGECQNARKNNHLHTSSIMAGAAEHSSQYKKNNVIAKAQN